MMHTNLPSSAVPPRTWRAHRPSLMVALAAVVMLAACAPMPPTAPGSGPLTPTGKSTLQGVKPSHFGPLAFAVSDGVAVGTQQPKVEFTVEETPPSIFVNFVVPDAQAAAFESHVALPPGFSLAKLRIIEDDPEPRYWLSLNVYRVSGLTTGLRAEWSTYVDDGSGTPRFMIVRARASEGSLDPLGPLALPEPFIHALDEGTGTISTSMNETVLQNGTPVLTADPLFSSTIELPAPADRNLVLPTRQWVTANDYIYWLNGVNDRIFHNSTSHSAPLLSVDLADVTLDDDTEWAPFVAPTPAHVLVYLDRIEFVISPWWNITEVDGRVAPATLASLGELKKGLYSGLTRTLALGVATGQTEPSVSSTIGDTPAATHWHWRIPGAQLPAFEAAIGLAPGLSLAPVRLEESDLAPDYWLSLSVSSRAGPDDNGLRAEWTTTVDDGEALRTLILESRSTGPSINPVELFTTPFPITYTAVAGAVNTSIGSGPGAFVSALSVPPGGAETLAAREWVGTSDLRYWRNGVADRVYYESSVFDPRASIDPGTVSVSYGGDWAPFADATPDRVWVDPFSVDLVTNPWWNLNGL